MINRSMYDLGNEPSAIRELFAYGMKRKAEIGEENVFDYSIGNPSVPAPDLVRRTILELMDEDPVALHGYSPASGDPAVRKVVAEHIATKFGSPATPDLIYLTAGAAAGIAISIAAITEPGDEVIVISPYFPSMPWIHASGCEVVEVPASQPRLPDRRRGALSRHHAEDERRHHQLAEQSSRRGLHPREPRGSRRGA